MALPADAFSRLRAAVRAERYVLLWRDAKGPFRVLGAHGLDPERLLTSEPVSISLFQEVADSNEPRWSEKMAESSSTSLVLSGIKSYLCIPLRLEQGSAIFYADNLQSIRGLTYTDLMNVHNLVQQYRPGRSSVKPPARPAPGAPRPPERLANIGLNLTEQANLFRCLAAFTEAGIPLLHGLHGLQEHADTPKVRELCGKLHGHLLRGGSLSDSLRHAHFDPLVQPLLRAAEQSGKLALVFQQLALHLEEKLQRRLRLRAALVYPAVVLACGLTMALLLPPYVLRDHLTAYSRLGPLPWPTRALVFMGTPKFGLLLLVVLVLVWRFARKPDWLWRLPGLQRVRSAGLEVTLATTLAMELEVGVNLLPALEVSLQACAQPEVLASAPRVLGAVREGELLSAALTLIPGVRPAFTTVLVAGEESGKLVECLRWTARLSKMEYDQSLDTAGRLLEPMIMLLLGLLVGFIAIASLLPTLRMLQ